MNTSRRAAGLGLLAYAIGTPVAFIGVGAPGGNYDDNTVTNFISSSHLVTAIAMAFLGAFATLGLLPFASRMRSELRSGGDILWGLAVGAVAASVIGWFLVAGVPVVYAEGGKAVTGLPHGVAFALGTLSSQIAATGGTFLVGAALLVLAARAPLPGAIRAVTIVGGVAGLLAGFYFPVVLFFLAAIVLGGWTLASGTREAASPIQAQHQPV
jgi:hypothetical protein